MSLFQVCGWVTWVDPNAPTVSRRTLKFTDGTQVAVSNLHEIMGELHCVGKKATRETVEEIIAGLEAMGNYISESEVVRRDYRSVLLKEYEEYIESHKDEPTWQPYWHIIVYQQCVINSRTIFQGERCYE